MKVNDRKENESLFMISGAVGTTIVPEMAVRAELELTATGNYEETETIATDRLEYKHGLVNLSLNFLKDFDAGKIKPYIGVGAGIAVFHDEADYDIALLVGRLRGTKKESSAVLSGNVQGGIAISLTDSVLFDVNARYNHFGHYKFKVLNQENDMKNNSVDVTAGFRVHF